MYGIGIDVGSTFTKYCVLNAKGQIIKLFMEQTPVRQQAFFENKLPLFYADYPDCKIVTCGYGRKNISYNHSITELTALAAGAAYQCSQAEYVLDIGGQDTELIRQQDGKLKSFFVNEKCAAGGGMFLKNVLTMLQMDFADIDLREAAQREIKLSSVCAVFAQSEIVELIAAGAESGDIVRSVLAHIMTQAKTLLNKQDCPEVLLSGGLTAVEGIAEFAASILQRSILLPKNGAYLSAIGCALSALQVQE